MDLEILKFGGSSLATSDALLRVRDVLLSRRHQSKIVVCSAMGGVTSSLLSAGRLAAAGDSGYQQICDQLKERHLLALSEVGLKPTLFRAVKHELADLLEEMETLCKGIFILGEFSPRSSDALVSFGERMAVPMVTALLKDAGMQVRRVDARDWIVTDNQYGAATVNWQQTSASILTGLDADMEFEVLITEGFIGRGPDGATTTLGRGGSDYTASLMARAANAKLMEKSTDVAGMMTADPRMVPQASVIETMSYEEALELCHFGAKVIYHPTIDPLRSANIPLLVRSTFAKESVQGTRIVSEPHSQQIVRGLSSVSDMALITLVGGGIIARPGFSRRVFTALAQAQVNVVLITQSSSEHTITLAIAEEDVLEAENALKEEFDADLALSRLENLRIDRGLSIIALVGGGMEKATGVSGRAFAALGEKGVNVRAIAQGSTERNISIVVASEQIPQALRALHAAFFERPSHRLQLICLGTGQVGTAFLNQLNAIQDELVESGLKLDVIAIARSDRHILEKQGLDLLHWNGNLAEQPQFHSSPEEFLEKALRTCDSDPIVVVDNTASAAVAETYLSLIKQGVHVVASNKIAASGPLEVWHQLRKHCEAQSTELRIETNVGAALPILDPIQLMLRTGDHIERIEAVLSGSLNYIFSKLEQGVAFSDAVVEAQSLGYTEPDPRLDLSGQDVARKILILARMAGAELELSDVRNEGFLPATCFEMTPEAFLEALPACNDRFASDLPGVWRFVAEYANGKCQIGLKRLPAEHPFAHLQGSDNQVNIYSKRYFKTPLVIRGSGAGADLTASGVFSDVLRLVQSKSHLPVVSISDKG
ncbi:MAG: bifunctional aspartate kinase/homoserine dehydrogenase I [Flavobacteriales bacterium]